MRLNSCVSSYSLTIIRMPGTTRVAPVSLWILPTMRSPNRNKELAEKAEPNTCQHAIRQKQLPRQNESPKTYRQNPAEIQRHVMAEGKVADNPENRHKNDGVQEDVLYDGKHQFAAALLQNSATIKRQHLLVQQHLFVSGQSTFLVHLHQDESYGVEDGEIDGGHQVEI